MYGAVLCVNCKRAHVFSLAAYPQDRPRQLHEVSFGDCIDARLALCHPIALFA